MLHLDDRRSSLESLVVRVLAQQLDVDDWVAADEQLQVEPREQAQHVGRHDRVQALAHRAQL